MSHSPSFLDTVRETWLDLRRRKVARVATVYLLAGWVVVQALTTLGPVLGFGDRVVRLLVLAVLFGFPVAVVLAWIFEWTGGRIRRTRSRGGASGFAGAGIGVFLSAVVVSLAGAAWWNWGVVEADPGPAEAVVLESGPPVVAVLPFTTADAGHEYFASGLHEQIIFELARAPDLRVVSRTSALRFASREDPVASAAREAGADAVLRGAVAPEGDAVRVEARLVSPGTGRVLWQDGFTRSGDDVVRIQGEVALAVADAVARDLSPDTRRRLARAPTGDPQAYRLYLRGRHEFNQLGSAGSILRAQEHLREAIVLDPAFAQAYAALAETWLASAHFGMDPHVAFPRADSAAIQALARDPELAEAHSALADARFHYDWAWESSDRSFRRAQELGPSHSTVYWWHAGLLSSLARFDEAIARLEDARTMDPASALGHAFGGRVHYWAGRYDEAGAWALEALAISPGHPYALATRGWVRLQTGEAAAAVEDFRRAVERNPTVYLPDLAAALASAGREREARAALDSLSTLAGERYVSPYRRAFARLALGERERGLDLLEEAARARDAELVWIAVDPFLAPFREEPRFRALLGRMGLPTTSLQTGESAG